MPDIQGPEFHRKHQGPEFHQKDPILRDPENIEDMKAKLREREDEQLKRVLEKRKAETEEELRELAKKQIVSRATRAAAQRKPLADRKIIRDEQAKDIKSLRAQLNEEIQATAFKAMQALPGIESKVPSLKERKIQPGAPAPKTDSGEQ